MSTFSIDDLRPGDKIEVNGEYVVVLAKVSPISLLLVNGMVIQRSEIDGVYEISEGILSIKGDTILFSILQKYGMANLSYNDLTIGDLLISKVSLDEAKVLTVAVMDSDREMVFDQDGNLLSLGNDGLARLGWRSLGSNFLTEEGRLNIGRLYK